MTFVIDLGENITRITEYITGVENLFLLFHVFLLLFDYLGEITNTGVL